MGPDLDLFSQNKDNFLPLITKIGVEIPQPPEKKAAAIIRAIKLQTDTAFLAMIMKLCGKDVV